MPHAWYALGQAKLGVSAYVEAVEAFERAAAVSRDPVSVGYLGSALARAGRTAAAEALLQELLDRSSHEYISARPFMCLYAALGATDRAFEWVERAFRDRDNAVFLLDVVPVYSPLRRDARFGEMLHRLGLPPPRRSVIDLLVRITLGSAPATGRGRHAIAPLRAAWSPATCRSWGG